MQALPPPDETERLQALRRYGILDTGPEQEFDDITLLASHVCGTPVAVITLIDEHRQWFKSKIGMAVSETARDIAFCAHGILEPGLFVVHDASVDPRFSANPLVTGDHGIRFYAGAPLVSPDGHALGMLCVTDQVPRELSARQKTSLEALGRQVVTQMELRRSLAELHRSVAQLELATEALASKTALLEAQVNSSIDGIIVVDQQGRKVLQNQRTADLFRIPQVIADGSDDAAQVQWVKDATNSPEQFLAKVIHLNSHPDEISRDELDLKDGTVLDRYSSPAIGKDGKYHGRIWTFRDITARKVLEAQMDRLRTQHAVILNSIGEGVHWIDADGRIKYENPAAARMLGYEVSELLGRPAHATMHHSRSNGDSYPKNECRIHATLKDGVVRHVTDEVFWRKDGTSFAVNYICSPVSDEGGRKDGVVVTFSDVTVVKLAEEALRDSEDRFRGTFEQAAVGIAHVSITGFFQRVNDKFCDITGYDRAELLGMTYLDLTVTDDLAEGRQARQAMLSGERLSYTSEKRYRRKNGEIVWINLVVTLGRTETGAPKYFISVFEDITSRKQAEESLRRSQMLLHMAGRLGHLGAWFMELPDSIIKFSDEVCAIHELPPGSSLTVAEAIGFYMPEFRPVITAAYETCLQYGTPFDIELKLVTTTGRHVWVRVIGEAGRDAADIIQRVQGAFQDITERKQAEESLRLLSSAVEQSKESIIITCADLDFPGPRILFVNPAFTLMTGYSTEEVLGKTPRILQGPRTDKMVLARLRQSLSQGAVFEGETINYRKDGTEFDLEWKIAPLCNPSGDITHYVAIQRDITKRKRLEAQLFQSQKMETVGKLAGGIAHEFNSILTAIIGQSEMLLGDLPEGSPPAQSVVEIRKAADRAATLTRQLLAYGRKQILQPETLDLNRVLAVLPDMLRHLLGNNNVDLRILPGAAAMWVRADAIQIEQVIMNMVVNARDAMPDGGKLTLETSQVIVEEESVGHFPGLKPGTYVRIAITDTGVGMNAEVLSHMFEPFFSTKDVGAGTGLGLATCYGIIKQSGGHITVYSERGRGTTFKIYLPEVHGGGALEAASSPAQPATLPRGSETILLVEDDPALRVMAATLLRRLGYSVLLAADGVAALQLVQELAGKPLHLVFTDVVMPEMNGRELSEHILASHPQTKILFTSAYTENAIAHQETLRPDVPILQKPFTPGALARKLREMLDQGV